MNAAASEVNIGNTGFMLLCASLVMLMTPGSRFSMVASFSARTS